jgi:hypothetical protein
MTLTQGIIDTQPLPRLSDLVASTSAPSIIDNPLTGFGTLGAFSLGRQAYGIAWHGFGAPSQAGRSARAILYYELPFLSLASGVLLADATHFVLDTVLTGADQGALLFRNGLPDDVVYDIAAGWQVNMFWLVAP